MRKAMYPEDIKNPSIYNKRLYEYIKEMNSRIGDSWSWEIDKTKTDSTWHYSNRLVTEDLIRHFCDAYGETNPLFRDIYYARGTRYGGIIAPPLFITCIAPSAIGLEPDDLPSVGFNGGADYEWFTIMRPGDEIHGYDTWLGYVEKKRAENLPRMFIGTIKRTYLNQRDEVVADAYGHELRFDIPPNERGLLYAGTGPAAKEIISLKPWKYEEKELEEITHAYEEIDKTRRGTKTRWWEDVSIGEELGTVVQGPYDLIDVAAFMNVQGYFIMAFGIKWKKIWNHTRYTLTENGTSAWEPHLRDHEGHGQIFNQSAQSEAGVQHLISNWAGDDGFLKRMGCQARRIMLVGDTSWIKGKVIKKYVQKREHLVDLEINCTTQRNIMHMTATATVRLLTRNQGKD
jgi:acyl dehydratase